MTRRPARLAAALTLVLSVTTLPNRLASAAGVPQATQPTDGTSEADLLVTIRLEEIRTQSEAFEAERLVAEAVREELRGRDEQAHELYARAAELDPDNENARRGLRAARDRLGLVTEGQPLIERAGREARIRRQEVLYRVDAALAEAGEAIAAGTKEGFAKARLQIDRARIALESDPTVFSDDDRELLDTRLRAQDLTLKAAIQSRADAAERARRTDRERRIKAARVKDIRLGL